MLSTIAKSIDVMTRRTSIYYSSIHFEGQMCCIVEQRYRGTVHTQVLANVSTALSGRWVRLPRKKKWEVLTCDHMI